LECSLEQNARAIDAGGNDFGRAAQWKSGGAVDDGMGIGHRPLDGGRVPNIALHGIYSISLRVFEGGDVQRANAVTESQKLAAEIDAEKTGTSSDQADGSIHRRTRSQ